MLYHKVRDSVIFTVSPLRKFCNNKKHTLSMSYLTWLALFAWIPTLVLWWKYHTVLSRYKMTLFYCILFALLEEVPWDNFAVGNAIWYFPEGGSLGLRIGILPLEEYLFIITVSA